MSPGQNQTIQGRRTSDPPGSQIILSSEHCELHHENSSKIESLCSTYNVMKWVIGVTLPLMAMGVAGIFQLGSDHLREITTGINEIKTMSIESKVERAAMKTRLDMLEAQIIIINNKIESRHK